MVSRENKVIAVSVAVALTLYFAVVSLRDLPFEVVFGLLMLVGVIAPMVMNNHLDNRAGD